MMMFVMRKIWYEIGYLDPENTFQCYNARPLNARLNPQQKSKTKKDRSADVPGYIIITRPQHQ